MDAWMAKWNIYQLQMPFRSVKEIESIVKKHGRESKIGLMDGVLRRMYELWRETVNGKRLIGGECVTANAIWWD